MNLRFWHVSDPADPAGPDTRRARRWQLAARVLWWTVATSILFWGAKQRFSLPWDPLMDGDAFGYLNPGLSKLTGGTFEHSIGREFLYPLGVFLNLCLFNDFRAITVFQHLIGLATAGLMLLAWQSLLALLRPPGAVVRDARSFLAAAAWQFPAFLMVDVYLAYVPTLLIEHTIRPECVFSCGAILSIWMNLRFLRVCWREGRPVAAWNLGAAHLFLSGVLFMLRPGFAFGVGFVNAPLLVALCTRRGPWTAKWRPVALALAAMGLLLFLPDALLRRGDRFAVILYPATRLFAHADLVLEQMDEDLASGRPLRYDRPTLQGVRDRLAGALADSRQPEHDPWVKLGFNPDYLYSRNDILDPAFPLADAATDRPRARFCDYYLTRAALHHPLEMLAKVGTQLNFFYNFRSAKYFKGPHFHSFEKFAHRIVRVRYKDATLYPLTTSLATTPPLQRMMDLSVAGRLYARHCEHLSHSARAVPNPPVLKWLDDAFDAAYLGGLVAVLAVCLPVFAFRRSREALGLPAAATLLLYAYNFGACLTIATVFYLGESRYVYMQKAFTLFSECAGLAFLARCALWMVGRRAPLPRDGAMVSDNEGNGCNA